MSLWQPILSLTLPQWVIVIVLMLALAILSIVRLASNILSNILYLNIRALEAQVLLPVTIFPMQDFRFPPDTLVFEPKRKTAVWVTPLHLTAYFGMNCLTRVLLRYSNVDSYPEEGIITPLYLALINRHLDTAQLLLKHGASPHAEYGIGPLHAAARSGLVDEIDGFVEDGVDVNSHCLDGAVPTVFALYLPEEQAIKTLFRLFENGADPFARFGPKSSWGLIDLASAMEKPGLACWLKDERVARLV
ncbi:hypothetical protein LRP88_09317 [Fusarium phalaenopsidis]